MAKQAAIVVLLAAAALSIAAAEVTVRQLGTGFEGDRRPAGWTVVAATKDGKPVATSNLSSSAAAFSGRKGARITKSGRPSDEMDVQLLSPGYPLVAGRTYRASLRLRSNQALNASLQWAYYPSSFATGFTTEFQAARSGYVLYEADDFTPSVTTLYRLVVALGEAPAGSTIDIDDVQVTVNAEVPELELIANASTSFEVGQANPFTLSVLPPASATTDFAATVAANGKSSTRAAQIAVSAPGPESYSVQLLSQQVEFEANYTYSAAVLLRSSTPGVPVVFSWNTGPPSYAYVKGSAAAVSVQDGYQLYALPAIMPPPGLESARVQIDFGGPSVPAGTAFLVEDITLVKAGPNLDEFMKEAEPVDRVFLAESFEETNSTFKPVTKGAARAEFDMASTAAASEGKRGARITVARQDSDTKCDHCISLASSAFPDLVGTTYTLSFDMRSSRPNSPVHVNFHMKKPEGEPITEMDHERFNASTSFRRYSTDFTSVKRDKVIAEINFGLASPGTVFDVDDVVITTDGGINVPIAAASTGFEAGAEQPYLGQVLVQGAGSFDFASTVSPFKANRTAAVTVSKTTLQQPWAVQMRSNPVSLVAGLTYTVTARMRATKPSVVDFSWTSGAPDYSTIPETAASVDVGSVWDLYTFMSTVSETGMYDVHFDFGKAPEGAVVYVDEIIATCDW